MVLLSGAWGVSAWRRLKKSTAHTTTTAFPSQPAALCHIVTPNFPRLLCMLSLHPPPPTPTPPQPPSCSASQQCASPTLATQPSTLPLP